MPKAATERATPRPDAPALANVLLFSPAPREEVWYELGQDYLGIPKGSLLTLVWGRCTPGELHTIELINGRSIFRYISQVTLLDGWLALEIHGEGKAEDALLSMKLVRRVGRVQMVYRVRKVKGEKPEAIEWPEYFEVEAQRRKGVAR